MRWKRSMLSDELILDLLGSGGFDATYRTLGRHLFPATDYGPSIIDLLAAFGVPRKVTLRKLEHMAERGLIQYGVSIEWPWPAPPSPVSPQERARREVTHILRSGWKPTPTRREIVTKRHYGIPIARVFRGSVLVASRYGWTRRHAERRARGL